VGSGVEGVPVTDLNDRAVAQSLPADLRQVAKPANDAAKRQAENEPRLLTVQQIMMTAGTEALSGKQRVWYTTGVAKLDQITGGLVPGDVWVFGADTSWGKSSWLIMVADEN